MIFLIGNGPMQTTAAFIKVTTTAAIRTMLQVKPILPVKVIEWGISFDSSAAGVPIQVELIETDVAATVTASVANDISKEDAEALLVTDPTTNIFSVGINATGYTATAEGTITATRNLAGPQLVSPTNQNIIQLPLAQESLIQPAKFARIRVTAPVAVNAYCYMRLSV